MIPQLADGWMERIGAEFDQPYMQELRQFLIAERDAGHVAYPPAPDVFRALQLTPFDEVRVVIVGQDPYHGPGQAHGLSFSVPAGVKVPPSLANIFRELASDVGAPIPGHGNLQAWAEQGVLLLNATLTVRAHAAASHQKRGWERFTDAVIYAVADRAQPTVFMLWGRHAQAKGSFIDRSKHLVLTAAHPSPLSAHNGFLGCRHFSKANEFLVGRGLQPIDWAPPSQEVPAGGPERS